MSEYPKQYVVAKGAAAKKPSIPMLKADEQASINLSVSKELKGDFGAIVYVATEKSQNQYTIHRSLGYTDLDDDEWVISASADIRILLGRTEHPSIKVYQKEVSDLRRRDYLSTPNMLYEEGDNDLEIEGELRTKYVHAAKKDSKKAWRSNHPAEQAVKGGKKPKAPEKEPEDFYIDYIPLGVKDAETQYLEFIKGWKLTDEFKEDFLERYPFETSSGVTACSPQVAFGGLKGTEIKNLPDKIMGILSNSTGDRYVEQVHFQDPPKGDPGNNELEKRLFEIKAITKALRAMVDTTALFLPKKDVSARKNLVTIRHDLSHMVVQLEGCLQEE